MNSPNNIEAQITRLNSLQFIDKTDQINQDLLIGKFTRLRFLKKAMLITSKVYEEAISDIKLDLEVLLNKPSESLAETAALSTYRQLLREAKPKDLFKALMNTETNATLKEIEDLNNQYTQLQKSDRMGLLSYQEFEDGQEKILRALSHLL